MMTIANTSMWIYFSIFVFMALILDTYFLQRNRDQQPSIKHALILSLIWLSAALIFNLILWLYLSTTLPAKEANLAAINFFTGYLIEKSLSVDNLFVFYMLFNQFRVPKAYQKRVFSIGIWSAIVFRLVLICLFSWLVAKFHALLYIMGAFLLFTGLKMLRHAEEKEAPIVDSFSMRMVKRCLRMVNEFHGHHFFIKKQGLWYATPLFLVLILIEISDLIFAFDSIPAIFSITRDPFIVWSCNIFAILGLRALYFVLAGLVDKLDALKYAIAIILIFIGVKLIIEPWFVIPVGVSLAFIAIVLSLFSAYSLLKMPRRPKSRKH